MDSTTRDRYEAICEASPDAILLVDADGEITYANARTSDLFGYDPEELLGEPIEMLVPPDARGDHVALREEYVENPETRPMGADVDLRVRRADGSTIPVDISLSPIESEEGTEVMAAVRDVSEQEELRTKYRTLLEAVPDAVVVAETDSGEIVEANDRIADLVGYDPEELLGEPQTVLHPSGEAERYRDLFSRHVASGGGIYTKCPDGSPIRVETKDGTPVPVEINAHVFRLGDRELIVGVFRDVTERRERERRLTELNAMTRRLMEADDRDAVANLVADAASAILGYASNVVRLANGQRLAPVAVTEQARSDMGARPDYPIDGDAPASRAYERGEPITYDDVREVEDAYDRGEARALMYLPMGEHGVISVADPDVGAFDDSDVELAAILAANAETAFTRLAYERELERQNERLEEFAGVVAHDLKNPLNTAQGWLDLARQEAPIEELDRVTDALDRMEAIVTDTLTLARQGRAVGDVEWVDVAALAGECWKLTSTGENRLDVADEFRVRGDRDRLRHLFENLFRNAVDHGGDDVTIRVGLLEEGFYVEDDGPGIPEEERDVVFEPGHTMAPDGTGFGLAIVKQIATAHGWNVHVTEGEDGGARFVFTGVDLAA